MKAMEAATLVKKKSTISKGKVKKSLRNVLCRPDPVFWPEVSDVHGNILESALEKHKVEIPEFKKPHWKELKGIPKEERPKAPKIPRVEGLIFGIMEATKTVENHQCSAVIIEAAVNTRTIVLPLIEQCTSTKVPVLCLNGLRKITSTNFGIPTSCLAIKCNYLEDLRDKICSLATGYRPRNNKKNTQELNENMEVDENKQLIKDTSGTQVKYPYLYRTSKRSRVFNPSMTKPKSKEAFVGQDFIEIDKPEPNKTDSKAYMSMILKKIRNNPNRAKK